MREKRGKGLAESGALARLWWVSL